MRTAPNKVSIKPGQPHRPELNNLATQYPRRVQTMVASWEAWAARANVLPLGAWRATPAGDAAKEVGINNKRFDLKSGDTLPRAQAPAIAGKPFRLTAQFETGPSAEGVIIAQGGNTLGYALYVKDGQLHFTVRNQRGNVKTVGVPIAPGQHSAVASLNVKGELSLVLDHQPARAEVGQGLISAMPMDGLEVGADEKGAVGNYNAPFRFTGKLLSVTVELLDP